MALFDASDSNVARWKLTTGALLTDTGGNGNGLTLTNNGTVANGNGFQGGTNTAAVFNGSTQYLSRADTAVLDISAALTISAWIRPTSIDNNAWIVSKITTGANRSYELYLGAGGDVRAILSTDGTNTLVGISAAGVAAADTWVHVAVVYDGSNIQMYVNGVASGSPVSMTGNIYNSNAPLNIGRRGTALSYFPGTIDDVSFWSRALSATEIAMLYNTYSEDFTPGLAIPTVTFSFTEYAPTVSMERIITIPTATSNFTEYAPTVVISTIQTIAIPTATFNFSRYAPVVHTTNVGIAIPVGAFNFTEYAPTIGLTLSVVIPIPTLSFPFTGHVPSVLISNSEEEISWGLFDTSGAPIIGVVATIKVRSRQTGYILDWSDNTYKLGGGTSPTSNMQEMDAANFPGYYYKVLVMGAWADGWYTAATTYAGTPAQNGATEFLIRSGQMVDSYNSSNLDAPISSRSTLAEIEGSAILAKQAKLDFMQKWVLNKLVESPSGDTVTLYDDNGTTPLKTWAWDNATKTRSTAT